MWSSSWPGLPEVKCKVNKNRKRHDMSGRCFIRSSVFAFFPSWCLNASHAPAVLFPSKVSLSTSTSTNFGIEFKKVSWWWCGKIEISVCFPCSLLLSTILIVCSDSTFHVLLFSSSVSSLDQRDLDDLKLGHDFRSSSESCFVVSHVDVWNLHYISRLAFVKKLCILLVTFSLLMGIKSKLYNLI